MQAPPQLQFSDADAPELPDYRLTDETDHEGEPRDWVFQAWDQVNMLLMGVQPPADPNNPDPQNAPYWAAEPALPDPTDPYHKEPYSLANALAHIGRSVDPFFRDTMSTFWSPWLSSWLYPGNVQERPLPFARPAAETAHFSVKDEIPSQRSESSTSRLMTTAPATPRSDRDPRRGIPPEPSVAQPLEVPVHTGIDRVTQQVAAMKQQWEPSDLHLSLADPVETLRPLYDYVVFDCPPRLSLVSFAALCASDYVIVPLEAADWGAQGIVQVTSAIKHVRQRFNGRLRLMGYLVSRFKRARSYQQNYLQQLRAHFGDDSFDTVIPDLAQFEKSVTDAVLLTRHAPASEEADIARRLFDEIAARAEKLGGSGVGSRKAGLRVDGIVAV